MGIVSLPGPIRNSAVLQFTTAGHQRIRADRWNVSKLFLHQMGDLSAA